MLHFDHESVFMDVAGIEPGRDFRKAIDQSVATCKVLLAVIGQEWLESKDAGGQRRLEDPNDFVRIELASALRRDIPVIPVLVRGARMPRPEQLPEDLRELAYRNAVELSHARWKSDVQVLIRALRTQMEAPSEATTKRAAETAGELKTLGNGRHPATATAATGSRQTGIQTAATAAIATPTIERIQKELAVYIGPISERVVKQAAKRCSSVEELCGMVAQEIEGEADRVKFLRWCRSQN